MWPTIVLDTFYVYVSHLLWAAAWQIFSSAVLQALQDDVSVALITRQQP